MNLNMVRPKIKTEHLLLSTTKNCQMRIKQTHKETEETSEFKLNKARETFHFRPPIPTERSWITSSTNLKVYNSFFNITEQKNKFDLYTDTFDEFSFTESKNELEEVLSISDITPYHLQQEIIGPRIIQAYKEIRSEKPSTDGDFILLMGYARSPVRDFESYLRIVFGLDGDDIQLTLKQNISNFVTCELSPGVYTIKDFSKADCTMGDHEGTLKVEYDDISMKTKLVLTPFVSTFGTLKFDEKSFFNTLLGFAAYWDYKLTNAIHSDSPGVYTNDKILYLGTINKIHLKFVVSNGSIMSGLGQQILFSFVLDKPAGYKIICEPETILYEKVNESVLITIIFY